MKNENILIYANDAIKAVEDIYCRTAGYKAREQLWKAIESIEQISSVDAVEIVRGNWEKSEYIGFVRCGKCEDVYINEEWIEDGKWNYCPNCGAKMKK